MRWKVVSTRISNEAPTLIFCKPWSWLSTRSWAIRFLNALASKSSAVWLMATMTVAASAEFGMCFEKFRHLRQYFEVFRDLLRDIGPLHFDDHFAFVRLSIDMHP